MSQIQTLRLQLYRYLVQLFLSEKSKSKVEKLVLVVAILSYLVHLLFVFLNDNTLGLKSHHLFSNPVSAIYTPFSFILIYEVYLLIYYLPKSTSIYIGKQYEIITLIVIRRIFKDIGGLDLNNSAHWFNNKYNVQFVCDIFTALLLFYMIYWFYQNIEYNKKSTLDIATKSSSNNKYLFFKNNIAIVLIPSLFILASYSLYTWCVGFFYEHTPMTEVLKNVNSVFFDDFFNVLIFIDVLLLLTSFFYSDKFHVIFRNSGFVISTILLKMSFSVEGVVNNVLIIGATLFGLALLVVYNQYEKTDECKISITK